MADDNKRNEDQRRSEEQRKSDNDKRLKDSRASTEERVAKAYEHEDPTPTQEENDAAKIAALGGSIADLPEGSGWEPSHLPAAAETKKGVSAKRNVEANQPAQGSGYQTRQTPASSRPAE
ncbi:MAG TPA: hypothetical protein VM867_08425 [Xanthobacteraceae bacterium]|nr:hypothetical protein [Xanthobacteraceae bacterium]